MTPNDERLAETRATEVAETEALTVAETDTLHEGIALVDAMTKAGRTEILAASPIPPGRFLIVLGGRVGEIDAAHRRGLEFAPRLHDRLFLAEVHPDVLRAVARSAAALRARDGAGAEDAAFSGALGLFETSTVSGAIDAADRGCKSTGARLLHLHVARGIAGKAFGLFSGRQDAVEAALLVAEGRARDHAAWVGATLLASPDAAVAGRLLSGAWGHWVGQEIL